MVDTTNVQTDYLKTEGLLTYGAVNKSDLDANTVKTLEESDRHAFLDDGTLVFEDKDGSTQIAPQNAFTASVNLDAVDKSVIEKAADIKYLAQNTGVNTSDMNAVYESLGIDPNDSSAHVKLDTVLKAAGYNPGEQSTFYGNNTANDVGAQILYDRWQNAPTEQDLIDAGLDPNTSTVINSNSANSIYLQEELDRRGIDRNKTSARTGYATREEISKNMSWVEGILRDQGEKGYYSDHLKNQSFEEATLDMLDWDLIKKTKIADPGYDPSGTSGGLTGTINTGGTGGVGAGGTGTGGGTGTYTGPNFVSTPNIGNITPVYGEGQTGLTEVDIPTYEAGLGLQQTQFENRATEQAKLYQPQTLAEQQAAGTAPAFENVLYRNRFGMSMYIQHINGVPSQPIPPGYYRVQGFGTEAQTQGGSASQTVQGNNQGGVIPRQANIAGQPHRLAYVNPQEEKLLKAAGGVGAPSYGGVPAYFTLGQGTTVGEVATDPSTGTKYTWNGTSWDITLSSGESAGTTAGVGAGVDTSQTGTNGTISAQSANTVNPALNYQPGGEVVQAADGTYKIKYPDGTYSQAYDTAMNAKAANDAGLSGLGLPSYSDYLQQQGIDMNLPGYDETAYQDAYQSYITNPATLQNIQAQQQQQEQTPETGGINAEQPTGQMDVTAEDLAQAQRDLVAQSTVAPGGAVAASPVSYIDPNTYGTVIESTAGQALGTAPMVQEDQVAQIGSATTADVPTGQGAATYDANQAYTDVQTATEGMTAATSTGPTQTIDAQIATGTSVSGLDAATGESVDVTGAPTRTLQTGEMVAAGNQGLSSVDLSKVEAAFGTGEVAAASVQNELASLMQQFEGGNTPTWAAGAMRGAMATMAARGLGASSMAGQAIIQAAMEAALPIAQIDTANKQQVALFKAEQRAKFLQMDFDQDFQAKVMNAAKVSEIANMNFTAEQQIALENSKAANTMALQNLSNEQALVMAEAAALSQLDTQNLNNRQQAAVQNAQNFLQIDMANLANEQQTALFKQQSLINSILSDQAAANAAAQFNATSENQTNQFFSNLAASVNQFNAAQMNAMKQFNADEVNSLLEFNASLQNQREMFNAQNYLVVAQANAQWRQNLATINTAAANESNMEYAQTVNALTLKTLDEIWQRERDLMDYSFTSSENAADRALSILLGDKQLSAIKQQIDSQEDQALGSLLTKVFFSSDFKSIFSPEEE